jgi:hypothetical protein
VFVYAVVAPLEVRCAGNVTGIVVATDGGQTGVVFGLDSVAGSIVADMVGGTVPPALCGVQCRLLHGTLVGVVQRTAVHVGAAACIHLHNTH